MESETSGESFHLFKSHKNPIPISHIITQLHLIKPYLLTLLN